MTCGPYIIPGSSGLGLALDDQSMNAQASLAVAPGNSFTVALRRSSGTYTCTAGSASVSRAIAIASATSSAGVRLVAGTAHYHWMMIVVN